MQKATDSQFRRATMELLKKINDGLKNIKEDGTFDKLVDEWFNK